MMRYQNAINYAIFLLPNMLSYAFVANSWIDKLNTYSKNGNTTGLYYYYGMIIKSLFFYDVPEEGSLNLKA